MSDNKKDAKPTESIKLKPKRISPFEHIRSQRKWNLERLNRAFMRRNFKRFFDFFTVGTSNKKPWELLNLFKLPVFSCNLLIDIRSNPYSRHAPDWNKNNLSELCKVKDIGYVHMPNLGTPSAIRKLLYSGQMTYEQFFLWYDANILLQKNLEEIVEIVRNNNAAFLCTEIGPTYCHRHRIALKLEENLGYVSFDL